MCIRDRCEDHAKAFRPDALVRPAFEPLGRLPGLGLLSDRCLLYTSDAADDLLCVDLGGRRIIKKKTQLLQPHHPL